MTGSMAERRSNSRLMMLIPVAEFMHFVQRNPP
jgi:hypothetical protein